MSLFFNNRLNNCPFNKRENNARFNMFQGNRYIQNQQQNIVPSDVVLKPLTKEELQKINEEIRENIEKNKTTKMIVPNKENQDILCNYIEEFIQDETNANVFYKNLATKCNNATFKERLKTISDECTLESNALNTYYEQINGKRFEAKNKPINTNVSLREGLLLAIEEELKSYDKLCKIIEDFTLKDNKIFYKIALKKLSRINTIQYMTIN